MKREKWSSLFPLIFKHIIPTFAFYLILFNQTFSFPLLTFFFIIFPLSFPSSQIPKSPISCLVYTGRAQEYKKIKYNYLYTCVYCIVYVNNSKQDSLVNTNSTKHVSQNFLIIMHALTNS